MSDALIEFAISNCQIRIGMTNKMGVRFTVQTKNLGTVSLRCILALNNALYLSWYEMTFVNDFFMCIYHQADMQSDADLSWMIHLQYFFVETLYNNQIIKMISLEKNCRTIIIGSLTAILLHDISKFWRAHTQFIWLICVSRICVSKLGYRLFR